MIGNLKDIDTMYKDHKVLKRPGHYELLPSGRRRWVPPKYRKIQAPCEELKTEQRRILWEELSKIEVRPNAHGFVDGKNIFQCQSASWS
jgi:hypothetical protein